mmetsp:Transcript_79877/g.222441  ORF Transcript_79877/g.222441 Transcript_79877/m.222441 type:complete len:348 (+) Transcript_79877:81-1124(+)
MAPAPTGKANASKNLETLLTAAQRCAEAGQVRDARWRYEEAWRCGATVAGSQAVEPLLFATAGLGLAQTALQIGDWPIVSEKQLDEILLDALVAARSVRSEKRSRALEAQLLLLRSQALFAKPSKTAECIDAAMGARFEAVEVCLEACVDGVPWSKTRVTAALALHGKADDEAEFGLEDLMARLRGLPLGGMGPEVDGHVGELFEAWAAPSAAKGGEAAVITVSAFLKRFLEVAERMDRAVDKEDCAKHAPCAGGLPEGASSPLEKELVLLVSSEGAGSWEAKAKQLRGQGLDATAAGLEALWRELAPKLKQVIESDAQMACGHSCSTCPTRSSCQVHDALKDIEDL